jgi:hypothetical protein
MAVSSYEYEFIPPGLVLRKAVMHNHALFGQRTQLWEQAGAGLNALDGDRLGDHRLRGLVDITCRGRPDTAR